MTLYDPRIPCAASAWHYLGQIWRSKDHSFTVREVRNVARVVGETSSAGFLASLNYFSGDLELRKAEPSPFSNSCVTIHSCLFTSAYEFINWSVNNFFTTFFPQKSVDQQFDMRHVAPSHTVCTSLMYMHDGSSVVGCRNTMPLFVSFENFVKLISS